MDSNKEIINAFDESAIKYADKYMDLSAYHNGLEEFAKLLPNNSSILDLACGPGNVMYYLQKLNPSFHFTGIDLSPNMLTIVKKYLPKANVLLRDVRLYKAINSYNGVICSFLLPYLSPQESKTLFKEIYNSLTDKGILYLSTMINDSYILHKTSSSDGKYQFQLNYYSLDSIKKMLHLVGFSLFFMDIQDNQDHGLSTSKDLILIAKK